MAIAQIPLSPVTAGNRPRPPHQPVLVDRVGALLAVGEAAGGVLVDATVGAGGHAAALLESGGPGVALVGFDRDPEALAAAGERLAPWADRVTLIHDGYESLDRHVRPLVARYGPVLAVLYDLGVSSLQLDRPERGFAFRADGPLDMRMDPGADGPSAAALVNDLELAALTRLLVEFGEERMARRIAGAIVRARPLRTTAQLAAVVETAVPAAVRYRSPTHPATRTFQALRIAVNGELDRFRASLPQALELAAPAAGRRGGRIAVLAYHSLEDRIAKQVFVQATRGCVCPPELPVCGCGRAPSVRQLTRGAETPSDEEVAANPRARSARLRAVEVLAPPPRTTQEHS